MVQDINKFQEFLSKKVSNISPKSVEAVLAMNEEGATVPFMARYRKEKTGNLDEVQIRAILNNFELWEEIIKRKDFVISEIDKQGALSDDLKKQILASDDLGEIEELYRPYKKKKKTKAKIAKDAGIEPFADWIWQLGNSDFDDEMTLEVKAKQFINAAAGFATYDEVLRGAQHIIVERLSNNPDLRNAVKDEYFNNAKIISEPGKKYKTNSKYSTYSEYTEACNNLRNQKSSHRYLAIRRGWQEGELKVSLQAADDMLLTMFENAACTNKEAMASSLLHLCAKSALQVHVIPSVTNELHRVLKEEADLHAINVFAENVRQVLMSSPLGAKVVLGIDPGLKTGCKVALVDNSGKFISHTVMHILGDRAEDNAKKLLEEVLKQIQIEIVAVGNGTGGREAEAFLRKILKELGSEVPVVLVNESGASVYSASDVAREEFPDLDLTVRGAISIARRLQDPLAELVKIEPKSIGVGQYQHDVSQTQLKKSLHEVVESCVNQVGVDLNTASTSLLQYVSGIGPAIAKNIIEYRNSKGLFKNREELHSIPQFSSKVFEQAAGFLRIAGGDTVLDTTGIHPERYAAVKDMVKESGLSIEQVVGGDTDKIKTQREKWSSLVGEFTFNDIISELEKPGRDPRDPFKVFKFREDIHEVKDLEEGMTCPGIVTNVTNFGAFVDIGVHQDGLVHISQMTHKFVNDPRLVVSPGDQVKVRVMSVDKEKNQISLSMLFDEKPAAKPKVSKAPSKGKPKFSKGKGDRKPSGKKPMGGGKKGPQKPQRPKAEPFNNPFAALLDLKK